MSPGFKHVLTPYGNWFASEIQIQMALENNNKYVRSITLSHINRIYLRCLAFKNQNNMYLSTIPFLYIYMFIWLTYTRTYIYISVS